MYSVSDETRKPIFEGVQGENESREIQFDISPWIEELGEGVCTATAKRPTDTTPYPVTVTRSGNVVTWKPNSTDTSIEGIGAFQLSFSINDVVAKTRIWNTKIAPSLVGAGDPPDPYDDWIQDLRDIAAETLTYSQNAENSADDAEAEKLESEAWAKGTKNGTPVPSTADQYQNNSKYFAEESYTYENNAKYWAEQSLANQYGAYIVKSASGDIASFADGADNVPMKSLNVTITPKQSGSGDPSPSNVRPISGFDTVNISLSPYEQTEKHTITGKNLYNAPNNLMGVNVPCHIAKGTTITVSAKSDGVPGIRYYNAEGTEIDYWTMSSYDQTLDRKYRTFTTKTSMGDCEFVRFYGNTGTDYMIELGSTLHAYEPYGYHTPVPLGQTVYGGTVNPISGELVINKVIFDLGDASYWSKITQYGHTVFYYGFPDGDRTQAFFDVMCSAYKNYTPSDYAENNIIHGYASELYGFCRVAIRDDSLASKTENEFKAAVAGIKCVYPLANPATVQLTPTQVASLLGTNNVWADCGAVEVEYRADPTLAYNELANVIVSLGGNL